MKKKYVVKEKLEFNKIIKNGKKIQNEIFIIFCQDNKNNFSRFGIAVSKKLGNAVIRNKIKRRIRNIIDNNKFLFKKNKNYIIMIKRSVASFDYNILNEKLIELIKKEKK